MSFNYGEHCSAMESRPVKPVKITLALALMAMLAACANRLEAHTSADYQGKQSPVEAIAVTGPGASLAVPAFDQAGYKVIDLGSGGGDPVAAARDQKVGYLATVDSVDSDGAWWDGFFAFSMRVTETLGRKIVWSAQADYGQSGITINQSKSTTEAMKDMVADFSKTFPPHK